MRGQQYANIYMLFVLLASKGLPGIHLKTSSRLCEPLGCLCDFLGSCAGSLEASGLVLEPSWKRPGSLLGYLGRLGSVIASPGAVEGAGKEAGGGRCQREAALRS